MKVAGWTRGALRRPDAAQSARADLHRGDDPLRAPPSRTSPGSRRAPRRASCTTASTTPASSPSSPGSTGAVYPVSDAPGLGVEVDEALIARAELPLLGSAASASRRRIGHQLVSRHHDPHARHHPSRQGPHRGAQGHRRRDRRRHARPHGLPQPAHASGPVSWNPGKSIVGPALTLQFMPKREDLFGEGEYADPEKQLHRHVLYHVAGGRRRRGRCARRHDARASSAT